MIELAGLICNIQPKIQQNKTTLVQLPLTTLGQETRWAYSTTPPEPTRTDRSLLICGSCSSGKVTGIYNTATTACGWIGNTGLYGSGI